MITERDFMYVKEIRKDALAHAQRERLIRLVTERRTSFWERYQSWLAKLGAWMVVHGQRLQARYAGT